MISGSAFCTPLSGLGYRSYSGVPCSVFGDVLNFIQESPDLSYVAAPNEGSALGISAGMWLAGNKAPVLIQGSGFGNIVNPLTSLIIPYRIPALIFISNRGDPLGVDDEPQHRLMGRTLRQVLRHYGVFCADMPDSPEAYEALLADVDAAVTAKGEAAAIIIPWQGRGTAPYRPQGLGSSSLARHTAIRTILDRLSEDEVIVTTTGKISREMFHLRDRPGNFYMQGSMGHARSIALGICRAAPRRRVILFDGDGATLMHLGSMSSVGFYLPVNMVDIVLDNETYESTGNQPTTSATTDLEQVARACGYSKTFRCCNLSELTAAMDAALTEPGPIFILIKVSSKGAPTVPRVTATLTQAQNARRAQRFISDVGGWNESVEPSCMEKASSRP
jgi:phosphonopyruvate decarboxylase